MDTSTKNALSMLPALAAKETSEIVEKVNLCLKEVLAKAGNLQGEINKQKKGSNRR